MLFSRNDHADEFLALAPGDDVHHRFGFVATLRHCLVETVEEGLIALGTLRDDDEGGNEEVTNHCDFLLIIERDDVGQVAGEALPVGLKRKDAVGSCLEMKMVWSRSTTLRTVVEHHQVAVQTDEAVHLAVVLVDELRLVLACRNGEVDWQNRERIHQEMEFLIYLLRHLFLRTVLVAKEARALAQGFLIYLGARTYDAGWVPLQFQLVGELAGFYVLEVAEAVAGICPHLQLAVEETRDAAVFHDVGLAQQHVLACLQFHGAQTVLIQVVGVHLLHAEGCITVASPTTAEVEFFVDSADTVTARECQAERIILTIRGVRKLDLSDQRSKEGARST